MDINCEKCEKLKGRVKYLEGLVEGDAKMLTAKLVEIQDLEQEYMTCVESFKEACGKLETIQHIVDNPISNHADTITEIKAVLS